MVGKRGMQALLSVQAQECLLLLSLNGARAASVLLELSSCLSGRKLSDLAQSSSEAEIYNWASRLQYQSPSQAFVTWALHSWLEINPFEFTTSASYCPV